MAVTTSDGDPREPDLTRPVFVVGPPRSGTTLLRHTLDRHPDLAVAPESHFLSDWLPSLRGPRPEDVADLWRRFSASGDFTRTGLDAEAVWNRAATRGGPDPRSLFVALLGAWAEARGAIRVGEKTPDHAFHVGTLLAWCPGARVVWTRRDPRDVVASELAFDQPWAADTTVVPATRWDAIERASTRWGNDPRVLTVRYEALVTDPDDVLGRVLHHAGLRQVADVVAGPTPREGTWHGGLDPAARPRPDSVGRWRTRLTARQAGTVDALTRHGRAVAGYPSVAEDFTGTDGWAYRAGWAAGLSSPVLRRGRRLGGHVASAARRLAGRP